MLPVRIDAQHSELLKLLNEMDECRSEFDDALSSQKTERAAALLSNIKTLADEIDRKVRHQQQHQRLGHHAQSG